MDLKNMKKTKGKFGVEGVPRGDNLFLWDVKLTNIDPNCPLGKDLQQYAKQHQEEPVIKMEMKFPPDYPMAPPFVRVLKPRFKFLTGHVTIGGSICMEMLTRSGWRPTNDIESILVQIRAEILSDNNARLDNKNPNWEYTESEAKTAFHRMVNRYGWE
ncbi:PREDICTED: ubiquitin-conjugating enzyme E2Q-like protein CG4502 [Branchiostoma belcheri]|uniref:Ubiquitin-conjugating enzyme E2Q-like protein CG4502 n=1 Tax=Branchiostoma belcheri TaxID=7741 RepID=A0A6P5A5A1_BRABE|nr:PREDICTED: ubiquitin-conjugating enzyme E2Q-like protein CG4502 [Branchiostoma belcheri]